MSQLISCTLWRQDREDASVYCISVSFKIDHDQRPVNVVERYSYSLNTNEHNYPSLQHQSVVAAPVLVCSTYYLDYPHYFVGPWRRHLDNQIRWPFSYPRLNTTTTGGTSYVVRLTTTTRIGSSVYRSHRPICAISGPRTYCSKLKLARINILWSF